LKQGTIQGEQKAEMLLRLADLYYESTRQDPEPRFERA
jgi:hypothetical protein